MWYCWSSEVCYKMAMNLKVNLAILCLRCWTTLVYTHTCLFNLDSISWVYLLMMMMVFVQQVPTKTIGYSK